MNICSRRAGGSESGGMYSSGSWICLGRSRGDCQRAVSFFGGTCQKKQGFCQKKHVSDFGVYVIMSINISFCIVRRENLFFWEDIKREL